MRNLVKLSHFINSIHNKKLQAISVARYCYLYPNLTHFNHAKTHNLSTIESCKHNETNNIYQVYNNVRYLSITQSLLKGKDRGKDKKKKNAPKHINENEMSEVIDVDSLKMQMDKAIEHLKNDFIKHINVRSSTGSIEDIMIKLDGKDYTVQDLTQIVRKPKMVVINGSVFPQALPSIMEALAKSGMNLNPQQDGTTIYVPTPKVTKEHREMLSKNAKTAFIKCRDVLKSIQTKYIKDLQEQTGISIELSRRVQDQIKILCDKYVSEAEKILEAKQKELLGSSE